MRFEFVFGALLALGSPPTTPNVPVAHIEVSQSLSDNESLGNSCSLGCAMGWEVRASSAARGHPVEHLDDYSIRTAWVASKPDRTPEIVFSFPKRVFGSLQPPVNFNGFLICPGFAGDPQLWRAHARPRKLLISRNGKPVAIAELEDKRVDQEIEVPEQELEYGTTISVKILSVFPGEQSHPVAIAALVPEGAH